jgi:hypothetical protein
MIFVGENLNLFATFRAFTGKRTQVFDFFESGAILWGFGFLRHDTLSFRFGSMPKYVTMF